MAGLGSAQQARVPAWKKLGLKLKHQNDSKKRSIDDISSDHFSNSHSSNAAVKRKKSVTFATDVKNDDGSQNEQILNDFIADQQGQHDQFTSHEARKFSTASTHPANLEPAGRIDTSGSTKKEKVKVRSDGTPDSHEPTSEYLRYLIQFGNDRSNWKFKKHDQTQLLKYTFSERRIPSQYFTIYLTYIEGLQGQARQRLAERAQTIVSEVEAEDADMEDVTSRDNARMAAMKQQLLNTKIRLRENEDDISLDDASYRTKYTKRRRAEEILKLLADVSAKQNIRLQDDTGTISTPSNQVINTRNGPNAAVNPGKRQRVRIKKARTGVPEDDISSVSSVELGPLAKGAQAARREAAQKKTEDSNADTDAESSTSNGSSSDASDSESDDDSTDTDSDDTSSADSDSESS